MDEREENIVIFIRQTGCFFRLAGEVLFYFVLQYIT